MPAARAPRSRSSAALLLALLAGLAPASGSVARAASEPAPGAATPAVSDPTTAAPAAPESTPGAIAFREIAGSLLGLESFEAEFVQTQEWVGQEDVAPARGTLYLQRPNLFRVAYEEPKGHVQVSDGTRVWTWVPENGEVLLARLSEGPGGASDPLRWVLENSHAEPAVVADTLDGRSARQVVVIPAPGSGIGRVRFWTRPGSPDLIAYEYVDDGGNRTRYRLTHTRKNPTLSPSLFRFTPPEGVPVVELGAP